MYILTKRTTFDDIGRVQHNIHGITGSVETARAWFRAGRQTDIVELPDYDGDETTSAPQPWAAIHNAMISENRFSSWREQAAKNEHDLALAGQGRK